MIRTLFLLVAALMTAATPCVAQLQISADFDGDGVDDIAELVVNTRLMNVDLLITTAAMTYIFPAIAFNGVAEGQKAGLALNPQGALEIRSGNRDIGRERWDQTMTILWQDDAFRLAALTRAWWDTLTPDSDGNCEVDFLAGKGIANGAEGALEIRLDTPAPALSDWNRVLPEGCRS